MTMRPRFGGFCVCGDHAWAPVSDCLITLVSPQDAPLLQAKVWTRSGPLHKPYVIRRERKGRAGRGVFCCSFSDHNLGAIYKLKVESEKDIDTDFNGLPPSSSGLTLPRGDGGGLFSGIPVSRKPRWPRLGLWTGSARRVEGADKGLREDRPGSGVQQSATKRARHTRRASGRLALFYSPLRPNGPKACRRFRLMVTKASPCLMPVIHGQPRRSRPREGAAASPFIQVHDAARIGVVCRAASVLQAGLRAGGSSSTRTWAGGLSTCRKRRGLTIEHDPSGKGEGL